MRLKTRFSKAKLGIAYNEHRPFLGDDKACRAAGLSVGEYDLQWQKNRTAAKSQRQKHNV